MLSSRDPHHVCRLRASDIQQSARQVFIGSPSCNQRVKVFSSAITQCIISYQPRSSLQGSSARLQSQINSHSQTSSRKRTRVKFYISKVTTTTKSPGTLRSVKHIQKNKNDRKCLTAYSTPGKRRITTSTFRIQTILMGRISGTVREAQAQDLLIWPRRLTMIFVSAIPPRTL